MASTAKPLYIIKAERFVYHQPIGLYIINSEGIAYHHGEGVYKTAACGGMESRRSRVWHHHEVMYVINPKEKYTLTRDAMPSLCDGFHTPCG